MLPNALTRILRRPSTSGFSGAGFEINSSFVVLHRAILLLSLENLTFAALVACTFFVNAAANSTYARIRPIGFILRPVYHHPDSSTLTILFLSTNLFHSVFSWTSYVRLHEIRVIRTRTSNRMISLQPTERFELERELPARCAPPFCAPLSNSSLVPILQTSRRIRKTTRILILESILLIYHIYHDKITATRSVVIHKCLENLEIFLMTNDNKNLCKIF